MRYFSSRSGEEGFGLLIKHRLVGGPAPLGDEDEFVVVAVGGEDVDLGGEIGAGVELFVHIEGDGLRIAQILLGVGLVDPFAQPFLILHPGPDLLSLLGGDGGGPGILADREFEVSGDLGITEESEGHALVILGRFGIAEDGRDLLVVRGAQEKGDIAHRFVGEDGQRLGADADHVFAGKGLDGDVLLGAFDLAVLGFIFREGEGVLIEKIWCGHTLSPFSVNEMAAQLKAPGIGRRPL